MQSKLTLLRPANNYCSTSIEKTHSTSNSTKKSFVHLFVFKKISFHLRTFLMQVSYSCLVSNQTKQKGKKNSFFIMWMPDWPMIRKFAKCKKQGCECILLKGRLQYVSLKGITDLFVLLGKIGKYRRKHILQISECFFFFWVQKNIYNNCEIKKKRN